MNSPALSSNTITNRHRLPNPGRPRWQRRLNLALMVAACCAAAWPLLARCTKHPGETVILLMPPALGAFLWFGWPRVRRTSWWKYLLYVAALVPILTGTMYFLAFAARGRVLWTEVFWALYFTIALRLAWTTWSWTVGRTGERWRRWGKRTRRNKALSAATRLIAPIRVMLTLLLFVPLACGFLVHRIKIGNPVGSEGHPGFPVQEVTFRTTDGLTLSGWFLPERDSEKTVVICHGAGANKSNFVEFMRVFRYQGYNSLIFDFRAHGASEGHTCTFGLYEVADVKAAVDWLKTEQPGRAGHVFGLGSSMGAMALARAAAEDPRIEAVVLDSCFASAPLLVQQHLGRLPLIGPVMATLLPAAASLHAGASLWQVDAMQAVASLSPRPVLFIHGTEDVMIPPVNMEILFDCAGEPKEKWLGPGPHSNIMTTDFAEYQRRVITFFDRLTDAPTNVPPGVEDRRSAKRE